MNWFSDIEKPKHPIVLALKNKGYSDFELNYSKSEYWCIESSNTEVMKKTKGWLGFTIKSSLRAIERL